MVPRLDEFIMLKTEAAIFVEQFWRDFYHSMLTRTMRNAMTKLLILALGEFLFATPSVRAEAHSQFVIAVDLTKSVAVKGPDGESEFKKNLDGVSHLLITVPAGASLTVIGITDRSFAQPLILLRARVPTNPDILANVFGRREPRSCGHGKPKPLTLRPNMGSRISSAHSF